VRLRRQKLPRRARGHLSPLAFVEMPVSSLLAQTSQGIGGEGPGFGLALLVIQFSAKADPPDSGCPSGYTGLPTKLWTQKASSPTPATGTAPCGGLLLLRLRLGAVLVTVLVAFRAVKPVLPHFTRGIAPQPGRAGQSDADGIRKRRQGVEALGLPQLARGLRCCFGNWLHLLTSRPAN